MQGISSGIYGNGSSIAVPGNLPALERELPLSAKFAAGAASGAFTSLMLTPIELVKCQMQVPSLTATAPLSATARYPQQKPPHALAIIASVFRHRGILGFWHGQLGTLIRETGGSAAWFGSYEGVSEAFYKYEDSRRRKNGDALASASASTSAPTPAAVTLPIWQQLIAGAIAGMSYNFIFFPADTIKSRMQTAEVEVEVDSPSTSSHQTTSRTNNSSSIGARAKVLQTRKTFWKVGRDLWAQQGIRGMYRGCGITVARAAPSSAFIFLVFEELKGRFGS